MTTKDQALALALTREEITDIRAIYDSRPYSTYNLCRAIEAAVIAKAETAITAIKQAQEPLEPVYWEYRHKESHPQTVNYGQWSEWERLIPRNGLETVESRVAEIQSYIDRDYSYELRALYAEPAPKQAELAWQPIETAPQNTEVIVAIQGGGVTIGSLMPTFGWTWIETDDEPEDARVIGWMPLPTPPEAK
jgi:hypothetical protein